MECILIFALKSLETTQSNDSSWCNNCVCLFSRLVLFRLSLMDVFYAHPWISVPQFKVCCNTGTCYLCSVQFSCSVMSDSLWPHEPQHARPPCPSPTLRVHPNPCPLCWWCHPTISSSVIRFSSCPQSFPASGSFQMSQLSASGGQSIGVSASASVLPMNTQDWSPWGWTGWISLQFKGLSSLLQHHSSQQF